MITNKRLNLLLFTVFLSLCSCQRPQEQLSFIYTEEGSSPEGNFTFKMDIADTLTQYSSEIVCKFRTTHIRSKEIDLCIELTSPSGKKYGEIVTLPLTVENCGGKSGSAGIFGSASEARWIYRDNIRASESGPWTIDISPLHKEILDGIYGIGFSYQVTQ